MELGKQGIKLTVSIITMIILLLATRKMQMLTDCIIENMKEHRHSEPLIAPNCREMLVNVSIPLNMILCNHNLSLYINNVLLEKYVNVNLWEWPSNGQCLHIPSDTQLCNNDNVTLLIVNGFRLSNYETKMLYMFLTASHGR